MNEKFRETLANLMQRQSGQEESRSMMMSISFTPKLDSAGFVRVLNSMNEPLTS